MEEVFQKIVAELKGADVGYQIYEHEPVYTSQDAANIRDTQLHVGLKALVLFADDKPIMVAVPGDKKVDFRLFKAAYGIKDLRMATADEVKQVTGVPIGAVPPFGHIFGIPLYADATVEGNDTVVFNAGLHTKSISLARADYQMVAHPVFGSFSKEL